jgi:type II secretory pathway component GspD/PulD (secretin)
MCRETNIHRTFGASAGRWLCIAGLLLFAAGTAAGGDPNAAGAAKDPNDSQVNLSRDGSTIDFINFGTKKTIRDALLVLNKKCSKNIVWSAGVDGPLTISQLSNVSFEQVLDAVLGNSFKYVQDANFVRVYTAEEYKKMREDPERMVFKIFTLYYISAAEAKKIVTPMLSGNAKVETTTAAQTAFPTGESISVTAGGGDSTAQNDMLLVYDYPERIEKVETLLKEVDVRPQQVLIEATVMAATLTDDSQFGVDWQTISTAIASTTGNVSTFSPLTSVTQMGKNQKDFLGSTTSGQITKTGGLTFGVSHDNVAALVKAVETVSDVTILANPKILAVNKQLGQVYIGAKIGYVSQTTQNQTSTTQSVEFLDTGTKLSFRPYIGNDGYIRMDIHPKDSSGTLKENSIPDETAAELVTNIIVKDGETVVIGGLFRDVIKNSRTQVPVLGNLPVLGALFRGTADEVQRQEVMVLLTPHIVSEPSEACGKERAEDVRMKREGAMKALQGIDRPRLAEDAYNRAAKYYLEGDVEQAVWNLKVSLMMRPTYLEARRLQERIMKETDPEKYEKIDSRVEAELNAQNASNWQR